MQRATNSREKYNEQKREENRMWQNKELWIEQEKSARNTEIEKNKIVMELWI